MTTAATPSEANTIKDKIDEIMRMLSNMETANLMFGTSMSDVLMDIGLIKLKIGIGIHVGSSCSSSLVPEED